MILLRNVSKTYHTGNSESVVAINDVSIELPSQGLVSIIGESGSGKTTLLNILSGLDAPDNGRVVAQFGETNIELSSATEDEMEVFRNLFMGYVHLLTNSARFLYPGRNPVRNPLAAFLLLYMNKEER